MNKTLRTGQIVRITKGVERVYSLFDENLTSHDLVLIISTSSFTDRASMQTFLVCQCYIPRCNKTIMIPKGNLDALESSASPV